VNHFKLLWNIQISTDPASFPQAQGIVGGNAQVAIPSARKVPMADFPVDEF
jgi:hypothetical protein